MTGEKCRHCGGAIEYVEHLSGCCRPWWRHVDKALDHRHEAAPAFGGGS